MKYLETTPELAEILPEWHTSMRAAGSADSTIYLRDHQIRRFGVWCRDQGGTVLGSTTQDLTIYLGHGTWAASTRRSARSALRVFFRWLQYSGRRADDPSRALPTVRVPIGTPRPAGELALKHALKHADERVRLMVLLAAVLGLRSIEICRCHTNDLIDDLFGVSLRVHGKGGRQRTIPVPDRLGARLAAIPAGYFFPGRQQGHLSAHYVSKLMSRALPAEITGHMLRHRAAGAFYAGTGYDLRATQTLLGHASVATTQIYTPAIDTQLRRGVNAAAV